MKFTSDNELPGLYIGYPQCGHCFEDVRIEDGAAYCDRCLLMWSYISEDETAVVHPNHEDEGVCGKESEQTQREPYDHSGEHWVLGPQQPCILPAGHENKCLHPYEITVEVIVSGNDDGAQAST